MKTNISSKSNKKILLTFACVALVASFASIGLAKKSLTDILSIPLTRVTPIKAEFSGEQTVVRSAECEDNKKLDAESVDCKIASRKVVYSGKIDGFVKGKWVAYGNSINDRNSGYGYTEGTIQIYSEDGKQVFKGKFQGAKQMLPTITEAEPTTTQNAEVVPGIVAWKIEGSMDLVGGRVNAGQKAFVNFEATQVIPIPITTSSTESNNVPTVKGTMNGVLVTKLMPMPVPAPEPIPTTETTTETIAV